MYIGIVVRYKQMRSDGCGAAGGLHDDGSALNSGLHGACSSENYMEGTTGCVSNSTPPVKLDDWESSGTGRG